MSSSMRNIVMNTSYQCSIIFPHNDSINIHANNLPLWDWWKHKWKTSKCQEYQVHSLLKSSSSIKSYFIFLKHHTSCSHFSPILLHRIFFMSLSPPLTSMSKVKVQYITSSIVHKYNNLSTQPQADLLLYNFCI